VEGFCFRDAQAQERVSNGIRIGKHVLRGNPKHINALRLQPNSSYLVRLRTLAHFVRYAVHLDTQFRCGTVKIEYVWTDWMLPANSEVSSTKTLPEQHFRQ